MNAKELSQPLQFAPRKAIESFVYLAHALDDPSMHKIAKIRYFADAEHLGRCGRFICGDRYIAMKHGPVPSESYDIFKAVRGDASPFAPAESEILRAAASAFEVLSDGKTVKAKRPPDLDEFSDSDIQCLDAAVEKYGQMEFNDLTKAGHQGAWEEAEANGEISVRSIVNYLPDGIDKSALAAYLADPNP